jgi:hypothetical protein
MKMNSFYILKKTIAIGTFRGKNHLAFPMRKKVDERRLKRFSMNKSAAAFP